MAGEWIGSRGSPPAVSLFESRLNRSDRFLVGPIHFPTVMLRTAGYRCLSCSFGSVFCALPERASRDGKQWRPAARGSEPRCTRRCRGNQWINSRHTGQLTNFEYFKWGQSKIPALFPLPQFCPDGRRVQLFEQPDLSTHVGRAFHIQVLRDPFL